MSDPYPQLETDRLLLRAFRLADAPEVERLAGEREIAATTENIPHPYELEMAKSWIAGHPAAYEERSQVVFAITARGTHELLGAIGLVLKRYENAEMGYWIGKPHWGLGYATEAGASVLSYGFDVLNLNRIEAYYFTHNAASGRVMEKLGMRQEGVMRQAAKKWGAFVDKVACAILREEWRAMTVTEAN